MCEYKWREEPYLNPSNAHVTAFCFKAAHYQPVRAEGQAKNPPNPNAMKGNLAHRIGGFLLSQKYCQGKEFRKPNLDDTELINTVLDCYVNVAEEIIEKEKDPIVLIEEPLENSFIYSPTGKADTAVIGKDDIYIVDLKYTDRDVEDWWFYQLAVYGYVYLNKYQKDRKVHLIIATPHGKVLKNCQPANLLEWGQRLEEIWARAYYDDSPVYGPHCERCPLRTLCYPSEDNIYRSIKKVNDKKEFS